MITTLSNSSSTKPFYFQNSCNIGGGGGGWVGGFVTLTVGSKTTITTINGHMTVTCSPGGHAFLQLLENVLVEVVDLRDVQEYPIDVSIWYYLSSTAEYMYTCTSRCPLHIICLFVWAMVGWVILPSFFLFSKS